MHTEKNTNGKLSEAFPDKINICEKVKEKHTVTINYSENIKWNKNAEKSMGDTQKTPNVTGKPEKQNSDDIRWQ